MKKYLLLIVFVLAVQLSNSQIIINEIGVDAGNYEGNGGDWIEFKNIGSTNEDLSCWRFTNGGSVIISFPNGLILAPGDYLLVGNAAKMMCAQCDFKSLNTMFTLNASGFGYGTGAYANTIFLNTESAIAGGCGCLSGSGDFNNGSNTGDRLMLFNNIGAIMDAFMFAGGNKYGSGALNVYFTGTASCGVSTYTLPATNDAIYNGHTICNDLSGCNSSYARLPDANNTLPITWDQSGNFICTSCTSPCTTGATNTAGTNYPTPGLPNGNSATTWSASLAGSPIISSTTNYAVCGATPLSFEYQINGFTNVALNASQASGNLGSYISINGASPINFSSATYNAASGITTLTANFTPPNGITTYEFVWADGNSFCTTCPGSNATSVPSNINSSEQECYVYRKVIVSRENALSGTPIATCSVPGSITVSGATGTNIQYTLMKQSTTGGPFLAVGGPFTSNIIANIIDDDASPTLPNYEVWVSSNNAACTNPAPIVVSVPNSCLGNPPCPKYLTSGTGAPTFTPASGATVCRNTNVQFSVNIQGVCNTGQVEVLYDYNPAFDPYVSGTSLGLAGTSVGTVPPTSMAGGKVFINEFVPRPGAGTCAALGITPNGASPNSGEWIELYNAGPGNVDISGWAVSDGDWTATIPSGVVLAVGGYYLIGGGGTFCSSGVLPDLNIETCNCATVSPTTQDIMNLTDGGEQIALYDCSGAFVDGVLWNVGQAIPDVTDNTAPASGCGNYITSKSLNLPASAAFAASGSSMSGTNQGRYRSSTNTWVTTTTSAAVPAVLPTPKAMNTGGNWNGGSLIFGTQCPPPPVTSTLNISLPDTCSQAGNTNITLKAIYRPDPVAPCSKNDVTATATYTIPSCELLTVSGNGEYCEPNSAPITINTSSALSGNYTINLSNGSSTASINSVTGTGPFTTNISQSGVWVVSNVSAPTGVCPPDANGQADIMIHPIPVITSAPATASFCYLYGFDLSSLESSIVSIPSTNQYVWYDVASGGTPIFPFVNPAVSTTYFVAPTTGTPAFCENTTRTPVVINVEPIPEIPAISCNGLVLTFLPTSPNCTPLPCSGGVQYSADGVNWAAGPSFTASDPGWAGFGTATTSLVYLRNTNSPACFNYATFFNPCFAALPTTLFNFHATWNSQKEVLLQWQTTDEKNVAMFLIERSADGVHFTSIGEVLALGNTYGKSDYQFVDHSPLLGNNYYRLKIMDEDEQYAYSNIIQLQNKTRGTQILAVYPNPIYDITYIEIQSKENEQGILQLIDALGKIHTHKTIDLQTGYNKKSLSLESIPAGVYQLQLILKSGVYTYKVIKQ